MPKVGNKKFSYSKEGIDKAKRYARKKKQSISKKFEEGGKTEYTPPSFFDMFNFGRSLKARRKNKPASEKAKMRHKRKMARQKARQQRKMFKIINK